LLSLITDGILNLVNHTSSILAVEPVSTSVYTDQNYGLSSLSYQEGMQAAFQTLICLSLYVSGETNIS